MIHLLLRRRMPRGQPWTGTRNGDRHAQTAKNGWFPMCPLICRMSSSHCGHLWTIYSFAPDDFFRYCILLIFSKLHTRAKKVSSSRPQIFVLIFFWLNHFVILRGTNRNPSDENEPKRPSHAGERAEMYRWAREILFLYLSFHSRHPQAELKRCCE